MLTRTHARLTRIPTPMAGLALGIASLGWCWENALPLDGHAKLLGALLALPLLLMVMVKFVRFPHLLWQDLAHPVVGSVLPTLAMGWMVVAHALGQWHHQAGQILWLLAISLHLSFLGCFIFHRVQHFRLEQMVPSWFVPPVGVVVADVTFPGGELRPLAEALLQLGLGAYAFLLPVMLYRLIFERDIPAPAKPTLAIMAAPASLCLAGYLTVATTPHPLLVALLAGIAVLMTLLIYVAFLHLLRLPFNPSYAAFTFPMVIGATALYKLAAQLTIWGMAEQYVSQIRTLAWLELLVATVVVGYVALRYLHHYQPRRQPQTAPLATSTGKL